MMSLQNFLNKKNVVAVVGASTNPKKWGYKVYRALKKNGFKVYPVNPKHDKIEDDKCYLSLESLPKKPDLVITVVPPSVTESVVRECKMLGIKMVWMQPGSESQEAIKFCQENNMRVVYNACFVMDGLKETFGD
ncbi:MAG: CoA-binding protein [Candidatus Aenigmarchaeota archaeon]|nr:CoA-binding protein [Candidatus Aenigmarchaeota archaeon]